MPTRLKVILVVLIATVGSCRERSVNRAALVGDGTSASERGIDWGRGRTVQACIDESLRRLHASPAFANEVRARAFLGGCLSVAKTPAEFCESVPRRSEVAAAGEWTANECRNRDAAEISRCSRVLQEVVVACDSELKRPAAVQTSK